MIRSLGVPILILCFGLSSVNVSLASQVIDISPIIVQPYDVSDLREISQQMIAQDRVNRDQELAIRGLIDDNQTLTDTALARQQDATLEKINQTMINYRDYLLARDRARVMLNGQPVSKYYDLIKLTEDVDNRISVGETLTLKSGSIYQKYKLLTDLKNELVTLNEELKGGMVNKDFEKTAPRQEADMQNFTQKLGDIDHRIAGYDDILAQKDRQIEQLKEIVKEQGADLKAKNDSIRWLKQVLAVSKNKEKYLQLTSQINRLPMEQAQQEVETMKKDLAGRAKDYSQFENAIVSLKARVNGLILQVSQKDQQVNLLKTRVTGDDRLKLARRLIDLQERQAALLEEKSDLIKAQNGLFDQRVLDLENKIKGLLANRHIQTQDWASRVHVLNSQLQQKEHQVDLLKNELDKRIASENDQGLLKQQLTAEQDRADQLKQQVDLLKTELENKIVSENNLGDEIDALKAKLQTGQQTTQEMDILKQQLTAEQDRADQLKQQLDTKTVDSDQMTAMMGDYQKKLESKDSAYNEELRQVLGAKNYQAQLEKQIADISARLQEKEDQVVTMKKEMYDLQESANSIQSKDLSLSIVQQKAVDAKINEYQNSINTLKATSVKQAEEITNLRSDLAAVRQKLKEKVPNIDEIDYLRQGFKKATLQLKEEDAYEKEFKQQSKEFQSLKEQLQDAQEEIQRKNEDLKYKDMAIARLKYLSKPSNLKTQVMALTAKLDADEKKLRSKTREGRVEALQAQLKNSQWQIKQFRIKLNQMKAYDRNDPAVDKLNQALDKINEQGELINALVKKLQDMGQNVNLTKLTRQ